MIKNNKQTNVWPSYFSTSVRVWEEIYSIVCTGYVPCQNGHLTVKSNVALLLEWVWQKYSRVTQDITDYNFENIDLHNDTYNYAWIETSSSYHLYFRNRRIALSYIIIINIYWNVFGCFLFNCYCINWYTNQIHILPFTFGDLNALLGVGGHVQNFCGNNWSKEALLS